MSKRVTIAASLLLLLVLTACTAHKPLFHECGGNNCRKEREFEVVEAEKIVVDLALIG